MVITRFTVALSVVIAVGAAFPVFAQDAAPVFAESGVASDGNVVRRALFSAPEKDCEETRHRHFDDRSSSWVLLHKDHLDPEYLRWSRKTGQVVKV